MEIEEAIKSLTDGLDKIVATEYTDIEDAYNRISADVIRASFPVPGFERSAMDGYAVRAEDTLGASSDKEIKLEVAGEIFAGDDISLFEDGMLDPSGKAVRIMTGGAVPSAFDAVIRQEDTDMGADYVSVRKSVPQGMNICHVGEDISRDEVVLSAGSFIKRMDIGTLVSAGVFKVKVIRKPHISIICTGSEIVPAGGVLTSGKIYGSIGYVLSSFIRSMGMTCTLSFVKDDINEIKSALEDALSSSDIVITTGGVSVGEKDLMPEVLCAVGAEVRFQGVNIKPGTPTIGAVKDGKAVLCLSGNPYAAIANFDIYFPYCIYRITGCDSLIPERASGIMQDEYIKTQPSRRLLRARICDGLITLEDKAQRSSVLSSLRGMNCYIDLKPGSAALKGDKVDVIMMPGGGYL